MAYYRLYLMSGAHFRGVEEFHEEEDGAAVGRATDKLAGAAGELWCGKRRVCRFDPEPAVASAPPEALHSAVRAAARD